MMMMMICSSEASEGGLGARVKGHLHVYLQLAQTSVWSEACYG